MTSRWNRTRQAISDILDTVAIGQAVESGRLTMDQARAALQKLGEPRSDVEQTVALSAGAPAAEAAPAADVQEHRELETAGTR